MPELPAAGQPPGEELAPPRDAQRVRVAARDDRGQGGPGLLQLDGPGRVAVLVRVGPQLPMEAPAPSEQADLVPAGV